MSRCCAPSWRFRSRRRRSSSAILTSRAREDFSSSIFRTRSRWSRSRSIAIRSVGTNESEELGPLEQLGVVRDRADLAGLVLDEGHDPARACAPAPPRRPRRRSARASQSHQKISSVGSSRISRSELWTSAGVARSGMSRKIWPMVSVHEDAVATGRVVACPLAGDSTVLAWTGDARRRQHPPRRPPVAGARRRAGERRFSAPAGGSARRRLAARRARLERVDAVGKNLLLRFEGGVTLRSHLRMSGRWRVQPLGTALRGRPWLVLRGREHEAVQWNGPVLELRADVVSRLGPDILAEPPDLPGMLARLRREPELPLGEAAPAPGARRGDREHVGGRGALGGAALALAPGVRRGRRRARAPCWREAHASMSAPLAGSRPPRRAYRRAGRPCRRCGTPIRSRGLGEANRTAYWCPACQPGSSLG